MSVRTWRKRTPCTYWWEYKLVQPLWNMEIPQTNSRITIWSSNSTPGHISRKNTVIHLKRCMYHSVQSSTIYNSQAMEVTQMSINRWMDKDDVVCVCVCVRAHAHTCAKSFQSYPTLCNPMDCSLPVSSVHGILQARILERVAMTSFKESSQPRDRTCISYVSCIGRWVFYH